MAPSATTETKAKTMRKPRRTHYKKRLVKSKSVQEASVVEDLSSNSSSTTTITNTSFDNCSKIDGLDFEDVDISTSSCSTPKAQRFRLPEIVSCPPAPKKQRVISNCSLQRKPIAFFAPPDIELFFFFALRDISV